MRTAASELDRINRQTWQTPATVRSYQRMTGWTDPGERAAVALVAPEVKGRPILDIGVGGGRTTELLLPLSEAYTAIDYTPAMVQACKLRHPRVDVRHMDARDLGAFPDWSFALVVFSFNGIDSVGPEDRAKVLQEIHRVLQPGGYALLSAHNRNGPCHGERPGLHIPFTWNPLKLGWRTLKSLRSLGPQIRNHRQLRTLGEEHEGWAIRNAAAHDFGIVIMYTTLAEQKRQLEACGFELERVFDNVNGQGVTDDMDTSHTAWFHYIARKPD